MSLQGDASHGADCCVCDVVQAIEEVIVLFGVQEVVPRMQLVLLAL